jgi:hypothetical protein
MRAATIGILLGIAAVIPGRTNALNGNQWRTLDESGRKGYVSGVVDTWRDVHQTQKQYEDTDKRYTQVYLQANDCVTSELTYNQLHAIVEKWMKDRPDAWHVAMSSIVWFAIYASCHK